jgi:hypothetical protein
MKFSEMRGEMEALGLSGTVHVYHTTGCYTKLDIYYLSEM